MLNIVTIVTVVMTVIFALTLIIGALIGFKKGVCRSGVSLGATVISAALGLLVTVLLKGVIADLIKKLILNFISIETMSSDVLDMIGAFVAAFVSVFVFCLIFFILRLLMLIPEKIVSKKLPIKLPGRFSPYSPYVPDDPSLDVNSPEYKKGERFFNFKKKMFNSFWHVGAIAAGALSALIIVGAFLMPTTGFIMSVARPIAEIPASIPQEELSEENRATLTLLEENVQKITGNPLLATTDFFFTKTVYEPLLTVKTEMGSININQEIELFSDIIEDIALPVIHIETGNKLLESDKPLIESATKKIAESDIVTVLGAWAITTYVAPELPEPSLEDSIAESELKLAMKDVFSDMTSDELKSDIGSAAELIDVLIGSEFLNTILESMDEEENNPDYIPETKNESADEFMSIVASPEFEQLLGEIFGVAYDNDHLKTLIIPLVNVGSEKLFTAMNADPIYADVDMSSITRDEFVNEAHHYCTAIVSMKAFIESIPSSDQSGNVNYSDFALSEAGKALDALRASKLFGKSYDKVVDTVLDVAKDSIDADTEKFLNAVKDSVANSESAENLMIGAQSFAVIQQELSKTDSENKGGKNEAFVTALDNLGKSDILTERENVENLAKELIDIREDDTGVDVGNKTNLFNDAITATMDVMETGNFNSAQEADALQAVYDLTHTETHTVDETIELLGGEEKMVEIISNSQIVIKMFDNINHSEEHYGINDKLTDTHRENIAEAIEKTEMSAENKAIMEQFFNINK